jgi:predicted ATPase
MNQYTTTELAQNLLLTPFEVNTNWHVLTGAACCGKTTLIDMLSNTGYKTIPEGARQYFDNQMAKGKTIQEIRKDDMALQREIFAMQLRLESMYQATEITFLDRACPDSLTFFRVFGMNPNEILPECFHHRYENVFILDRLTLQRNKTLGPEDNLTSEFLNDWLFRDYSKIGYNVMRVPVLSPQERMAFILNTISENAKNNRYT